MAPVEFNGGFVGPPGFHWPFTPILKKTGGPNPSTSDLRPSPLDSSCRKDRQWCILSAGRAGGISANLDSERLFKVFYGAAVQTETANQPAADIQQPGPIEEVRT